MTKIKICGLSRPADIDIVNEVLPDYIGFVFAKSRRQVSEMTAMELRANLNPKIKVVGVFVNDEIEKVIRLCNSNIIDIVQLHGDEGEVYLQKLKTSINNPIIKAVRVRNTEDIKQANKLSCDYLLLDAYKENQYGGSGEIFDWSILGHKIDTDKSSDIDKSSNIDNPSNKDNPSSIDNPSNKENPSNTDNPSDIDNPSNIDNPSDTDNPNDMDNLSYLDKPYFLAGGINSGNVMQAMTQGHPYCIDVSSGVETDGYKDADKIVEIIKKIRSVR